MTVLADKIKLNLGSRNRSIPGFKGMDCDPHPGVDLVGDISNLSMFADGEAEAIYASHCLEHFPHLRTLDVLKEWVRVLAPGGVLYVAVPDFKRAVELYLNCGLQDWIVNFTHGDQGYATAYHYAIFDFDRLKSLLLEAGFSEVSQVVNFPIGDPADCSHQVSTFDGRPNSLNVVAVK
jgi:predicted SAM-dependent methyltransferase